MEKDCILEKLYKNKVYDLTAILKNIKESKNVNITNTQGQPKKEKFL